MLNERLLYLMDRYVRQQQTEAEMAELRLMLGDKQYEDQVKMLIDQYSAQGLPAYKMREGAGTEILETILETTAPATQGIVRSIRPFRHIWWAAAVVVLCGAGIYLWQRPARVEVAATAASQPGTPGSNKAILTLADGAEVALDDKGNQQIQQGTTAVHQQNGLLQYHGSGDPASVSYNTLYVPRGGQFQLILPDGTKVWLNAASRLKYPTAFSGRSRVVELQGEAYFEVAKRADQPFSVKVNNKEVVEVLGTDFNIMSYTEEVQSVTTLVTGAVKVISGGSQQTLRPGQQALVDEHTGAMTVAPADVDRALAWKTGFFELDNTDLPTLMRQLSRWYDVEIIDQSKGNTVGEFGGRISRTLNLRDVLHVLEQYGVHSRIEDNKVVILSK
ncbi:FecR family protein [Chitinophaga sp. S165]|uniref:FecR family protein n=1 Tax=Chitinophaga sp. S165 TaxID=2135462 RepID=UPI000D7178E0|nr:FecR domain-containing protein [Chitinophaga sp. S165]PWV56140.1 FecR family protein [Chitinophaga sp. S165]